MKAGDPLTFEGVVVGQITGVDANDRGIFITATINEVPRLIAGVRRYLDQDRLVDTGPIDPPPTPPARPRCESCNAYIDPLTNNCRCFD